MTRWTKCVKYLGVLSVHVFVLRMAPSPSNTLGTAYYGLLGSSMYPLLLIFPKCLLIVLAWQSIRSDNFTNLGLLCKLPWWLAISEALCKLSWFFFRNTDREHSSGWTPLVWPFPAPMWARSLYLCSFLDALHLALTVHAGYYYFVEGHALFGIVWCIVSFWIVFTLSNRTIRI